MGTGNGFNDSPELKNCSFYRNLATQFRLHCCVYKNELDIEADGKNFLNWIYVLRITGEANRQLDRVC